MLVTDVSATENVARSDKKERGESDSVLDSVLEMLLLSKF